MQEIVVMVTFRVLGENAEAAVERVELELDACDLRYESIEEAEPGDPDAIEAVIRAAGLEQEILERLDR